MPIGLIMPQNEPAMTYIRLYSIFGFFSLFVNFQVKFIIKIRPTAELCVSFRFSHFKDGLDVERCLLLIS